MIKLTDRTKKIIKIITIAIFAIYVFSICLTWLMTIDYNLAPDERMKMPVCEFLVKNGTLPHGGDESIRDPIWGISYAFTPILSYMFSAVFMKILSFFTQNGTYMLWAARFVSVLCLTGYAIMCYKIGEKLFKGAYKWLFAVFATLLPQVVFLGSYLNNDTLALLSISIIVYSWITGLEKNWDWRSCITLAIGIGICALSYYNAYGYLLCSIIIYIASCYIKKINIKEFFKKGIAIALIAFAIGGWWFVRNYILYDGDFIGLNVSREYGEMYAQEPYKPSNRTTPANTGKSLTNMLFDMKWIQTTFNSFVGLFGNMHVKMDPYMYTSYSVVFIIGLIGLVLEVIISIIKKIKNKEEIEDKEKIKKKEKILFNIIMGICLIIPIILSIYYSYFNDFQPQGRYIMPMIIPFMYFIVTGYKRIFNIIKNKKIRNIILGIIILIWSIAPIYIYFEYIKKFL